MKKSWASGSSCPFELIMLMMFSNLKRTQVELRGFPKLQARFHERSFEEQQKRLRLDLALTFGSESTDKRIEYF
jgi:hypothetical protein